MCTYQKFIALLMLVLYPMFNAYDHPKLLGTRAPVRYYDFNEEYNDLFLDRIYSIVFNNHTSEINNNYAPAILIDHNRMLTSFNPYREAIKSSYWLSMTLVPLTTARTYDEHGQLAVYTTLNFRIKCARQIVHFPDEEVEDHLWHGPDRRNSPLHDLLIVKLDGEPSDRPLSELTPEKHVFSNYVNKKSTTIEHGIFLTAIANRYDYLYAPFKFASFGFSSKRTIEGGWLLEKMTYTEEDDAVVDCGEWIPRNWGYFICILNLQNFPALGSGAMLISDNKVFGIGSFAFYRGKKSIYVFTDVRYYYENIIYGCESNETNTN